MQIYDDLWEQIKEMNETEKELLLLTILLDVKASEAFNTGYPVKLFKETIKKHIRDCNVKKGLIKC